MRFVLSALLSKQLGQDWTANMPSRARETGLFLYNPPSLHFAGASTMAPVKGKP
jgi:hypothetical protein